MTTLAPRTMPPRASGDRSEAHRAARARVFHLLLTMQPQGGLPRAVIDEIIEEGEVCGWPDVVKLGLLLDVLHQRDVERRSPADCVAELIERTEVEGDTVMTAFALAVRAQDRLHGGGRAPVDADRDLARATVLLEGFSGRQTEAVSAHIECAAACEGRELWELQLAHYEAAEACIDPHEASESRHAVLLYNRAEVQLNWVAALRERRACDELPERAALASRALDAADVPIVPDDWREELAIFRELLDAMCTSRGEIPPPTRTPEGDYRGYVHLTRALTLTSLAEARRECDLAVETIDPHFSGPMHLFALALAVELEAADAGHETAGLRWGRELTERRWERRLAALASMESLIAIERLSAEHAELQQHAFLDDLTGLANRRALARFTDGLRSRGARTVAVALVDLDRFKSVNDGHGHPVGDAVLQRMAGLLRAGVRDHDLVARLGGDEFLLLLTMPDHGAARRRCEAIMESIAACPWAEISPGLAVSASLGVATGSLERFDQLCAAADAALYRAKKEGRGRLAE
ncbi:MAG TPA: GGDEF domain-containing protein [Solirubrobacteraceae bacterium]|nr:GGDEF domain-containing protein [Solirubrobacteraceae bacterium]